MEIPKVNLRISVLFNYLHFCWLRTSFFFSYPLGSFIQLSKHEEETALLCAFPCSPPCRPSAVTVMARSDPLRKCHLSLQHPGHCTVQPNQKIPSVMEKVFLFDLSICCHFITSHKKIVGGEGGNCKNKRKKCCYLDSNTLDLGKICSFNWSRFKRTTCVKVQISFLILPSFKWCGSGVLSQLLQRVVLLRQWSLLCLSGRICPWC